mmetsp:Transcript_15032/g.24889  ORF Transcript_15032/g.24889 Transcript_15032/m.24889 type:complete len:484 (+) Transcript_15032:128-1579(+)|eukprot:CAMPEP_0114426532 /NCGR_PEP_ID=MMETSP0103-20121206/7852_1 /TAXON_ID=37642 ORGANISM="Paraphysomonas imperforata, Strain PA2" /NCGR_SAMPLE_ID=MMETSP0103 /ASSEMBLY_ACC=CAM_ASM_000201 /LENGTH=483 /DNA_ID=CAMNT_0001595507 /DNA_START=112 /DNA_END=1563 /DNA_ORIENTATION=+
MPLDDQEPQSQSPLPLPASDDDSQSHCHSPTPEVEVEQGVDSAPPRYLAHTFSSKSCGSSQHAEAERVAHSFRTSNFQSLQALPAKLRPGGVEESRRKTISSGRSSKPEYVKRPGAAPSSTTSSGLFAPVTYSRDEYNKTQKDEETRRQCKQLLALSFSRKPFTCASSRARLKNEDIFGDEKYRFPVLGPGSRVTELETVVRTDFTDASKMLHGPFFVPARVQQAYPRDDLALWGRELFEQLGRDWAHLRFSLRCRGTDELAVSFDLPEPEPAPTAPSSQAQGQEYDHDHASSPLVTALGRYMNTMALHGVAAHRRLRKRGDRWRVLERAEPAADKKKEKQKDKQQQERGKLVLVFAFYTPWFSGATRNIQKRTAQQERVEVRSSELQRRAAAREARQRAGGSKSAGPVRERTATHSRPRRTARCGSLSAHGERDSVLGRPGLFDDVPAARAFSTCTLSADKPALLPSEMVRAGRSGSRVDVK